MGSMHTGLEDRARDFPKLAAYFAERARGGVGLMVTGGFAPNIEGWLSPFGSRIGDGFRAICADPKAHEMRINRAIAGEFRNLTFIC